MSNMSYCRYENTAQDLADCYKALYERKPIESKYEAEALLELIGYCKDILDFFDASPRPPQTLDELSEEISDMMKFED